MLKMKSREKISEKISLDEMKEAILSSGYLIEKRVERIFQQRDLMTFTNNVYKDLETNKPQELDLAAIIRVDVTPDDAITIDIQCECENNKQPVVFFESPFSYASYFANIKYLGLPEGLNMVLADVANNAKSRKLYSGICSSQYCSFFKPKSNGSKWQAMHLDEQHNTFEKFIKYLKEAYIRHETIFNSSLHTQGGSVDEYKTLHGTIHYMVIVLEGDIYSVRLKGKRFELKEQKHIKYLKHNVSEPFNEIYYIDVITESYLPNYIDYVISEKLIFEKYLRENREALIKGKQNEIQDRLRYMTNFIGEEI
jgi:hypothetical protein